MVSVESEIYCYYMLEKNKYNMYTCDLFSVNDLFQWMCTDTSSTYGCDVDVGKTKVTFFLFADFVEIGNDHAFAIYWR